MKYFLIILICFISCSFAQSEKEQCEKIISISRYSYGGELGYAEFMKVTQDSIYHNYSLIVDGTNNKNKKKRNLTYKLQDIVSINALQNFSQIKDGESRLPTDGSDTYIVIETNKKKISVMNGEDDTLWNRILNKINGIMYKEFKQ